MERAVVGMLVYSLLAPVSLFLAAGDLRWRAGWCYVALQLGAIISSRLMALKRHPEVLLERARYASDAHTPALDRLLVLIVGIIGPAAMMATAGLDRRFQWSALVPNWGQILAGMLVAVGFGLGVWAMAANPFFSAVARVQRDRDHQVVQEGPYGWIRHPAYAGALLSTFATPMFLDSLWALIPTVVNAFALIIRTRLEDRMLLEHLESYQEYAERTRFRLIPGLW
jgi:protein-S-isoprenylcysteine O-methyltransferase Ste14